jgi:hypothetical protein
MGIVCERSSAAEEDSEPTADDAFHLGEDYGVHERCVKAAVQPGHLVGDAMLDQLLREVAFFLTAEAKVLLA